MYYGPQPTHFHPYSPWGWSDEETHLPSYYRSQYIEYATPTYSEKLSSYKDRFDQNRSGAQAKKKVVKQVYRVKYDGRKKKSSYLNSTIEKPITLLKNPANDGKEVEKSSFGVVGAKFEQNKMKVPKIKKELMLSKIEAKPTCSIGLPKWQEKNLQKLSAEKLREEGFAWVPKESIQPHKDDAQVCGTTKAKKEEASRNNCQVRGLH
jgi:ribosomal protein L7/L12